MHWISGWPDIWSFSNIGYTAAGRIPEINVKLSGRICSHVFNKYWKMINTFIYYEKNKMFMRVPNLRQKFVPFRCTPTLLTRSLVRRRSVAGSKPVFQFESMSIKTTKNLPSSVFSVAFSKWEISRCQSVKSKICHIRLHVTKSMAVLGTCATGANLKKVEHVAVALK